MTKLTVPIMVTGVQQALSLAVKAAEHGADLVEFRIDRFTAESEAITALVEQSPLPCVVTCRLKNEGGEFDGDEATRIACFEAACAGTRQPAYLDVELVAWQKSVDLRQAVQQLVDHPGQVNPTDTGLILSNHDFDGRPIDLYQRIEAMLASPPCRVMKIAWRARSLRDNLEAFNLVLQRHKPTIALCMGEAGLPSRLLSRKFGALLTFVASEAGAGTAPGQPTLDQIKRLYRWDALNAETKVYGVIGWPVGHSISPAFHNAGFEAVEFNGVYLPMPIPPEYEHFKATAGAWLDAGDLHFRGASVTIPHKANLLRFVKEQAGDRTTEIEPLAERIGAANTLTVRDDGSLLACNTDYAAALDAVCEGMGEPRAALAEKRVAVIGAGGAARAIVAGFAQHGATVVVYNRTFEKAEKLAGEFNESETTTGKPAKVVAARLEKLCDSCCHVFINCTPIGMHPNVDASPIPAEVDVKGWGPGTVVFDTVYNPPRTKLLEQAAAAGCVTIGGAEMFIRQGVAQFEQWTHEAAPMDVLRGVVDQALSAKG